MTEKAMIEMKKLKTLKDFNCLYEDATVKVLRNQLRESAIAHILQIQELSKEKEGEMDEYGFDTGMRYDELGNAIIGWILFFFNITKEDLGK